MAQFQRGYMNLSYNTPVSETELQRSDKLKIIVFFVCVGLVMLNIYVVIHQYETITSLKKDIELEHASKDWWYGAAVGCMESSGYWNASKQAPADNKQSWVFWDGYKTANHTIQSWLNSERRD